MQRLYDENRKEKLELLKGVTIGWDDNLNITPLQQVPSYLDDNILFCTF